VGLRIGNPRVTEQLTRLFNLTGTVSPELEEFVLPTVQIANLDLGSPPALQRTATFYAAQGAVGGERAVFQLAVPPGVVAVIKRIMLFGITAQPRALLARFAGTTATVTTPATVAGSCFTDGRLHSTGVQPSSTLYYNTQVSNVANADWALPLYLNNATWNSAAREFVPNWGWVVGSGNSSESGFWEATFDIVNTAITMTLEIEEFVQD
jgi:hypothetical protein